MIRRTLPIYFLSFFLLYQVKAQSLDATLQVYANQYEQEKVHIHFDKDAYLPGETIWMKAYIMLGSKPSNLSKNIYFDWTDINGKLLLHSVSPVMEGVSTSSFTLPSDFAIIGNAVHIKAYTQWMLNFDSSFLFNKNIAVLSSWDGSVRPDKHAVNIQFFAEGGDLVTGLSSVIAFEATDQRGRPVNVKGVIKKSNDEVVDSFATAHEGMGALAFSPHSNETYTAYWKDEFGDMHTTPMPQAKSAGAVMRITTAPRDNMIHFQVERPLDAPDHFKSLTVIGTSDQQVVYKSTIDLGTKTIADGGIDTRSIPDGIVQITVFDTHMSPFAERIVFVNNHQSQFSAQLKKELINFNKRGRNEISIEVPDSLTASLSVSITDGGLGYDTTNNIITDLLLSSDLRGNITNPAYYFSGNSDSANAHLDLLMRTHGWRRFKWEDAIAGKFPFTQYPAETDYMAIKGKIDAAQSAFEPNDSIALLVMTRDRKKQVLNLPLNANGSFMQKGIFFYDSLQIVYQLNHISKINPGTAINLQTSLLPAGSSNVRASEPAFEWTKVPEVILEKESNGLITENHNYSRQSTGMNYVFSPVGRNDQSKTGYETASHYLQTMFPDLKFPYTANESNANTNSDNRYVSFSFNDNSSQPLTTPAPKNNVNLLLDGSLVNMNDLKQISMKEILFIKFLQKTNPKDLPTLAITSRQSIYQNNIINNKTGFAVVTGYTPAKEFYSPKYTENPGDDQATDFRSTLYWNPRVVADKNNRKIKLVFYNNDVTNKFRVVVEGMNKGGKLTRIEEIIK